MEGDPKSVKTSYDMDAMIEKEISKIRAKYRNSTLAYNDECI